MANIKGKKIGWIIRLRLPVENATMSLLFRVLMKSKARSNHHRIALDALRHLRGPHAERWRNLFLKNHKGFLDGAKAPEPCLPCGRYVLGRRADGGFALV